MQVTAGELIFCDSSQRIIVPAGTECPACALSDKHPETEGMIAEARRRNAALATPRDEWVVVRLLDRPVYLRRSQITTAKAPPITVPQTKPAAAVSAAAKSKALF